jgi:hypothetical protein
MSVPRLPLGRRLPVLVSLIASVTAWVGAPAGATFLPAVTLAPRVHAFPAIRAPRAKQTACSTGCALVQYLGGPVQHGQTVYLVFWAPRFGSSYLPPSYRLSLATWLGDVAAGNYTAGNVFSVAQQYYDLTGPGATPNFVPYAESLGGVIVDTNPYPASGCTDVDGAATQPECLTDAQVQTEIKAVVTSRGLPQNNNTSYALLTPKGVGSCYTGASKQCAYSSYCGYHSFFAGPLGPIVYAELPWTYTTVGCDADNIFGLGYPNGSASDPEIGIMSDELIGMMTDPNLNGWHDAGGAEIGDKCAYIYGPGGYGSANGLASNGLGSWNQQLKQHDYLMPLEFSNRDSDGLATGCMASDTDTQPAVTISIQPSPVVNGTPSTYTANVTDPAGVSSVQWNFGDNTTSTSNPVDHTYAAAGTYNLSVIVTDNHGNEQQVTESVAVS